MAVINLLIREGEIGEGNDLANSLQNLTFGADFNQSFVSIALPDSLAEFDFGTFVYILELFVSRQNIQVKQELCRCDGFHIR